MNKNVATDLCQVTRISAVLSLAVERVKYNLRSQRRGTAEET